MHLLGPGVIEQLPNGDETHYYTRFVDRNRMESGVVRKNSGGNVVRETRNVLTRWAAGEHPIPITTNRPEAMKRLDSLAVPWRNDLAGWLNELTVKTSENPGEAKKHITRLQVRSALAGHFLEGFEDSVSLPDKQDYWLLHAPTSKYRLWRFSADGGFTVFDGAWDDATKTISWKDQNGPSNATWTMRFPSYRDVAFKNWDPQGNVIIEARGVSKREPALLDVLVDVDPKKGTVTFVSGVKEEYLGGSAEERQSKLNAKVEALKMKPRTARITAKTEMYLSFRHSPSVANSVKRQLADFENCKWLYATIDVAGQGNELVVQKMTVWR